MATTATTVMKQKQSQKAEQQQNLCCYCRKPGHVIEECWKRIRKGRNEKLKENAEKPNAKTYPPCLCCRRTNHTADMCGNSPKMANRLKRYKTEYLNDFADGRRKPATFPPDA